MPLTALEQIAQQLVSQGKGILAADESLPTIKKRFDSVGVESTENNRLKYRNLLFTTNNLEDYISGVILFEETLFQTNDSGVSLVKILQDKGIIPGIKVDKGTVPLANFPREKVTQGLDGLRERLLKYATAGAKFTKWRAVINLGEDLPSEFAIACNSQNLARFAAISQEAGLVPIVEPEILMDGTHELAGCEQAAHKTLHRVFYELFQHRVQFEGMLLKASMVTAGKDCPAQASVEQVSQATLRVLSRCLPSAVPGVVFLSGGQSPTQASENLNALNQQKDLPWELSFSFGRALQAPVLKSWRGEDRNQLEAQHALYARAKLNGAARHGKYSMER